MNYTNVTNLKWANAENTVIECLVKFDNFQDAVPFAATPNDPEAHGKEIFARAVRGEFGEIAAFTPPTEPQV